MPKISYLSGPANFEATYAHLQGDVASNFFGANYVAQFIRLIESIDGLAQVITWRGSEKLNKLFGARFSLLNLPMRQRSGVLYHLDMLKWNIRALVKMIIYRPDILLLTGNQDFWWIYAPLRLFRVKIITSFHCVQWPVVLTPRLFKRLYAALNTHLILKSSAAILVTSLAIRRQVETMLGSCAKAPIIEHLPTYDPAQFADLFPPTRALGSPFELLFVGRLEANKGIFDVLRMARELEVERPGQLRFHICGDGSEANKVEAMITNEPLLHNVICHGYCETDKLRAVIEHCHAYIVPTRSNFEAGFEMTCAEAILSRRPLITSRVAPAIEYLGPASIEVPPDDVESYKDAIVRLADDPLLYKAMVLACEPLRRQFFDEQNSWTAALARAIEIVKGSGTT